MKIPQPQAQSKTCVTENDHLHQQAAVWIQWNLETRVTWHNSFPRDESQRSKISALTYEPAFDIRIVGRWETGKIDE